MEPMALPAVGILLTPEQLSGERVHTMTEGQMPALCLDTFLILC